MNNKIGKASSSVFSDTSSHSKGLGFFAFGVNKLQQKKCNFLRIESDESTF